MTEKQAKNMVEAERRVQDAIRSARAALATSEPIVQLRRDVLLTLLSQLPDRDREDWTQSYLDRIQQGRTP